MHIHIVGQGAGYQVTEIGVSLRASREYSGRGWRTIQLSATADVIPGANVEEAHNDLYEQLRKRITLLFNEI
ncbi:MAG: hypothetical protein H8E47_07415 [Anaerolineales bacterium]|nr:hypothetical protein [Anaerolineales bacterium]